MKNCRKTKKTHILNKICIFLLITVTGFGVYSIHTYAREKADNNSMEVHMQDSRLLREIRNTLEENGYDNSGVTLTKVMDNTGCYVYNAKIHHKDIDIENEEQVQEVYSILRTMQSDGAKVEISYKIF